MLHVAAISMVWSLLGSPWNGRAVLVQHAQCFLSYQLTSSLLCQQLASNLLTAVPANNLKIRVTNSIASHGVVSHWHFLLVHVVQVATDRLVLEDEVEASTGKDSALSGNLEFPMQRSLEERYLEVMKQLQFGMCTYLCVQCVGVN